jgi:hypothetical protein
VGDQAGTVHISDETFVAAAPALVAAAVHDPARWRRWWPDLTLTSTRDRGVKGHQWAVGAEVTGTAVTGTAVTGTAEIWLEPWRDGTILHLFLRLAPVDDAARERRVLAWKRAAGALKDELEGDRRPGEPAVGAAGADLVP